MKNFLPIASGFLIMIVIVLFIGSSTSPWIHTFLVMALVIFLIKTLFHRKPLDN